MGRGSKAFVLGVLLFVEAACAAEQSGGNGASSSQPSTRDPRPSSTEKKRIVFAGTSLTAGLGLDPDSAYPQLVQQKIDSAGLPFVVENAGVSGETSAALLQRIDWLLRDEFDVIVVETGANDGLRGVPVSALRSNLKEIVGRIQRSHPKAAIALVQMEAPPNLGPEYTGAFRSAYADLARETGAVLLPFLLDSVAGIRTLNQGDGIHPNIDGERIVARNVWRGLEGLLRERIVE
jgi:acyl-CoA thioesterase I